MSFDADQVAVLADELMKFVEALEGDDTPEVALTRIIVRIEEIVTGNTGHDIAGIH